MEQIIHFFRAHKPQCIFFLVFMGACVPVLYYYWKRNPNPRFRPTAGEMTLVTVFCAFLSGGLSVGLGGVFNENQDFRKLADKASVVDDPTISTSTGSRKKGEGETDKKATAETTLMNALKGGKN
jgi:hypothetical protein